MNNGGPNLVRSVTAAEQGQNGEYNQLFFELAHGFGSHIIIVGHKDYSERHTQAAD